MEYQLLSPIFIIFAGGSDIFLEFRMYLNVTRIKSEDFMKNNGNFLLKSICYSK